MRETIITHIVFKWLDGIIDGMINLTLYILRTAKYTAIVTINTISYKQYFVFINCE